MSRAPTIEAARLLKKAERDARLANRAIQDGKSLAALENSILTDAGAGDREWRASIRAEGVHDRDTAEHGAVLEILGVEHSCPGEACRMYDQRIPERNPRQPV